MTTHDTAPARSRSTSPVRAPNSPSSSSTTQKTVVVIGAGLVGALAALYFAEAGWNVRVYEMRNDLRKETFSRVRSINLALSHRGITALRGTRGVQIDKLMALAVPMHARMVHSRTGDQASLPYGMDGECIYSIDRRMLNEHLLDLADALPNVSLYFNHEITSAQLDMGKVAMINRAIGEPITVTADLVVGADGAHSAVRRELMRPARMAFQQEYIDHAYLELTIPAAMPPAEAAARGNPRLAFHLDPNHLHIWPRGSYMMIALANPDGSFTCTMFAPWNLLDAVKTPADLRELFAREFADAVPMLPDLEAEFFGNPRGPLMTIKAKPYHVLDRAVIIGDAAHAMVPFFGQGMNCGFEDVQVLFAHLRAHGVTATGPTSASIPAVPRGAIKDASLGAALASYSTARHVDVAAMCDLALANYEEMRAGVASRVFRAQRVVERLLSRALPFWATPLYTMVAFTSTPYAECLARGRALRRIALAIVAAGGVVALGGTVAAAMAIVARHSRSQHAPALAAAAAATTTAVGSSSASSGKLLEEATATVTGAVVSVVSVMGEGPRSLMERVLETSLRVVRRE
ncbi:hypothetical protein BC828DRAFT_345903 [Blastocladiella britannica]|nr:hypothetical protein BC828DRAFT_345903 [Blastocladiella britannica]